MKRGSGRDRRKWIAKEGKAGNGPKAGADEGGESSGSQGWRQAMPRAPFRNPTETREKQNAIRCPEQYLGSLRGKQPEPDAVESAKSLNAIVFGFEDQLRRGRSRRAVHRERPCGEFRGSYTVVQQRQRGGGLSAGGGRRAFSGDEPADQRGHAGHGSGRRNVVEFAVGRGQPGIPGYSDADRDHRQHHGIQRDFGVQQRSDDQRADVGNGFRNPGSLGVGDGVGDCLFEHRYGRHDRGHRAGAGGHLRHSERSLMVRRRHKFSDRDHYRGRTDRWKP